MSLKNENEILELKEKCLPEYLLHDIKEYLKYKDDENCTFIDCLKDEIYGSINGAYWDNEIDEDMANYLRNKYLYN